MSLKIFLMDWIENKSCLRCNEGGKLLICNENGCPIAVHEKCLGCHAQYDDLGNFYCPYCMFKRVTEEMCQARAKAMLAKETLSNFINDEMTNDDSQKQKTQLAEKKELTSSVVERNESFTSSEHSLENDTFQNQSVHLEEHCSEERFPTSTSTPLSCEGTEDLIAEKRNKGFLQGSSHNFGHNECKMIVVYKPPLKSIIVDDGGDVQKEEIMHLTENIEVAKMVSVKHPAEIANYLECVERCRVMPVDEDKTSNGTTILSTKRKRNHVPVFKETDRRAEEVLKTTVPLEPEPQLQSKYKRGVKHRDLTCRDNDTISARLRSVNLKKSLVLEPQDVKAPRESNWPSASEEVSSGATHGDNIIGNNSRSLKQPSNQLANRPALNGKRGRKCWTPEEVDMLKEGVEKYARTVNKNLPWRKILEFGQHIFDESRTPTDLKDKWRNILAKVS